MTGLEQAREGADGVRRIGPYRLLEELGRGAQGQVFLAEDTRLSRRVALKVLSSSFSPSPQSLRRFQREAETASRLDHPGICAVYEAGEAGGCHYIAMRYLEGETLARKIAARAAAKNLPNLETLAAGAGEAGEEAPEAPSSPAPSSAGGPSTRKEVHEIVQLIERIARALHAAHEAGLIHRDIKPGNIMITREGDPVILDFGLARAEDSEVHEITHSGELLGTPAYMSPEQLVAHRIPLDRRTDVYSLGVTLYECLTLRRPYEAASREALYQEILVGRLPDATKLNRAIPRDLKVVLETALDKDRGRRYATALELAEDLRRVRSYEPILARPAGPVLRARRWAQRNPVAAAVLLCLFVGLAAALLLLARIQRETEEKEVALREKQTALEEREAALSAVREERDAKTRALAEKEEALARAEGLYLTAQASSVLPRNPSLALLLALEGEKRQPGLLANNLLAEVLLQHREEKVFPWHRGPIQSAAWSPDGQLVLSAAQDGVLLWDAAAGKPLLSIAPASEHSFSPVVSGDWKLILAPARYGAQVLDAGGSVHARLAGHEGRIRAACFDAGGRRAATASEDGTVRVWELPSGRQIALLRGDGTALHSVEMSADGRRVLAASDGTRHQVERGPGGTVVTYRRQTMSTTGAWIWSAETGEVLRLLGGHFGRVAAALSPDGSRVATASQSGPRQEVRIWDVEGEAEPVKVAAPWGTASYLAFSPGGERLLTVSDDLPQAAGRRASQLACIWDATSGAEVACYGEHEAKIDFAAFSPDGSRIATASADRAVCIWNASTGETELVLRGHDARVTCGAFSAGGKRLLTASRDGLIRFWNVEVADPLAAMRAEAESFTPWLLSPDGRRLALAKHSEGALTVWDAASGAELCALRRPSVAGVLLSAFGLNPFPWPLGMVFSRDGAILLTSSANELDLWELPSGKHRVRLAPKQSLAGSPPFTCWSVSREGARAASSRVWGSTAAVLVWDGRTGELLHELRDFKRWVQHLELSDVGDRLLVFSGSEGIKVFDTATGRQLWAWQVTAWNPPVRLSPDGERIAFADGGALRGASLVAASSGALIAQLAEHTGRVTSLAFSADGKLLATTSEDQTAIVWDGQSGERLAHLRGHTDRLHSAVFSLDGALLLTFSDDGTARVWEVRAGKEIVSLPHPDGVSNGGFLPERRAITVSPKNAVRIWPLELAAEARRRRSRELAPEELERYGIGSAGEREERARSREIERLQRQLEIAAVRPAAAEADLQQSAEWRRLLALLGPQPAPESLERLLALADKAAASARGDAALLLLVAELKARAGREREAVHLLESSAAIRSHGAARLELERLRGALLPDLATFASIDAALESELLIPPGAEWRFFRGRREPSPGLEWTALEFDDSGWESGASGFGYGDDDDATILEDMQGAYTTLYIRRRFHLAEPSLYRSFELAALADDGCVIYLNGREVGRARAGSAGERLAFDAEASALAREPLAPDVWPLDAGLFRAGSNVLAIQGLNRGLSSSDFSLLPVLRGVPAAGADPEGRRFAEFLKAAGSAGAQERVAYLQGRLHQLAGSHREARAKFESIPRRDAQSPEPYLRLAESLLALGDARSAQARLREGLETGDSAVEALWEEWMRVTFVHLRRSARDALAALPAAGGRADLRWLLEELASRKAARINCGGGDYAGSGGVHWAADRFATTGLTASTSKPFSGTADGALYQSERWFLEAAAQPAYRIPLPAGRYRVTLHFGELYHQEASRRFDVLLQGKVVLEGYDTREAGFLVADKRSFELEVEGGFLEVGFLGRENNPKVAALELEMLE
jgi:WD40 repeat protein/serine/threonine protein kinase